MQITDISVDSEGNIYANEIHSNQIKKFSNNGQFVTRWKTEAPLNLAANPTGEYVYVIGGQEDNRNISIFQF